MKFQSNKTNSKISNMTIVFSNYNPKTCILGIFVPRFKDFYFATNFTIKQIWGCWFQIWQCHFGIPARKYLKKHFVVVVVVVNVSSFCFCMKLRILKNLRVLISKMATVFFQILAKITQIRNFHWKLKSFFFLSATLSELDFI